MKRTLTLMLALLLLAAPALAEDNFNAEGYPIVKEPITITVSGMNGPTKNWNETFVIKQIEKELGIKMDCQTFAEDIWPTQLNLMLATDALPDMLMQCNLDKAEMNQYGEDGYLLDMSQYLDVMPNFKAFLEKNPDYLAYTATQNGAIYSINNCYDDLNARQLTHNWIKKSWLENVGKEMPTTIDELYDVLVAFKEMDANGNGDPNDEIPMSLTFDNHSGQRVEFMLKAAFGVYSCPHYYQLMADGNNQVYLADLTQNWKDYLTFMNKLYEEKLLDNEAFIHNTTEFNAKGAADKLGFFGDWSGLTFALNAPDASVNHDYNHIIALKNVYDGETYVTMWPTASAGARVMISATTQYPRECCRLVDYIFSPEGIVLANYGVEGETFDYVTDTFGNKSPKSDKYWEAMKDQYGTKSDWTTQYLSPGNVFTLVKHSNIRTILENATDEELEAYLAYTDDLTYLESAIAERDLRAVQHKVDTFPNLTYTADELDARADIAADISNYLKTMKAQFITGEADLEKDWDNFVSTVQGMGLDKLLKIEQAAYDRSVAALGSK